MYRFTGSLVSMLVILLTVGVAAASQHQPPMGGMPSGPGGGMMSPGQGMMMCPMMGMMGGSMMGGMGMMNPSDPKSMGQMMQMHGEMMQKMGEIMMKHGKQMMEGK